jgi:hypothetical protein
LFFYIGRSWNRLQDTRSLLVHPGPFAHDVACLDSLGLGPER